MVRTARESVGVRAKVFPGASIPLPSALLAPVLRAAFQLESANGGQLSPPSRWSKTPSFRSISRSPRSEFHPRHHISAATVSRSGNGRHTALGPAHSYMFRSVSQHASSLIRLVAIHASCGSRTPTMSASVASSKDNGGWPMRPAVCAVAEGATPARSAEMAATVAAVTFAIATTETACTTANAAAS